MPNMHPCVQGGSHMWPDADRASAAAALWARGTKAEPLGCYNLLKSHHWLLLPWPREEDHQPASHLWTPPSENTTGSQMRVLAERGSWVIHPREQQHSCDSKSHAGYGEHGILPRQD